MAAIVTCLLYSWVLLPLLTASEEYGGNSNGQPCVFPFAYKSRTFYTCTNEDDPHGRFWCATTGSRDKDQKWSYCSETRLSTKPTGPCVFPFIYEGKLYTSCTTDGESTGRLWCSLTSNYDEDPKRAYCDPSESLPCKFPFIYNNKSYSACTRDGAGDNILWCGTSDNYDRDSKWKACSIQEYGGNSNGQPCVFPFTYKSRTFYTCSNEDDPHGRFWCATTGSHDKDEKWSYCADTRLSTKPTGPCVFPFIYKGKPYTSCTTDGESTESLWCSLTSNYDEDPKWTYCDPSEYGGNSHGQPCVFPFAYKSRTFYTCTNEDDPHGRFWCATTGSRDKDQKWNYCADTRLSTKPTGPCVFPFIYKGKLYTSCTTDGESTGRLWCSLTSNYDEEPKWAYCDPSESLPCKFPFIYNKKSYSACTRDGAGDNILWCGTSDNYDRDSKWKACSIQEYGGNANGQPCVFPFTYKSRTFYTCTNEADPLGRFWCATTGDYDRDQKWSYCADTRLSTKPTGPCVFPFIYKGKPYTSCTTDRESTESLWCSLTSNYDEDPKWTYCDPSEYGGNSHGQPCVFPFAYKSRTFYTCTNEDDPHGRFWCATTGSRDKDQKWNYCADTRLSTTPTGPCVFPFIYKGKLYTSCTTDGESTGRLWCSLTSNYDEDPKRAYCYPSESLPCKFPFIYNKKSYSACTRDGAGDNILWCGTSDNYDKDSKWKACSIQEYGGNANGQPCVFPFTYKSRTFYTCTNEADPLGRFWCATTGDYDRDQKWSYCADTRLSTTPTGPCVFPFIYKGKPYTSCTTDGESDGKLWCSLTSNYDEDPKWTYCDPSDIVPI